MKKIILALALTVMSTSAIAQDIWSSQIVTDHATQLQVFEDDKKGLYVRIYDPKNFKWLSLITKANTADVVGISLGKKIPKESWGRVGPGVLEMSHVNGVNTVKIFDKVLAEAVLVMLDKGGRFSIGLLDQTYDYWANFNSAYNPRICAVKKSQKRRNRSRMTDEQIGRDFLKPGGYKRVFGTPVECQ